MIDILENNCIMTTNRNIARRPLMGYDDVVVQDDSKCWSCTRGWLKTFLIFFNIIILLISLALLGLGIYLLVVRLTFVPALIGEIAYVNHFLLLIVGTLLLATCVVGFVGARNGDPKLLKAYGWILTALLILQLITGILAFLFSGVFENWLIDRMKVTMQTEYTDSITSVDKAVDEVQQRFKCCGSQSFRDWTISAFQNSTKTENAQANLLGYSIRVPDSCCIRVGENCGHLPHPSNVFHQGCMPAIFTKLRERYYIICVVALTLIAVEIFGIVFGCCYSQAQKQR